ncbi:hypothetical protein DCC35_13920 [Mangrovivirga cuniculi]|uniref:Peptidase C1A papain C-terminal domain-containing protein n=2 Tax=Mangrovivirga cuniculi TaxID=2715131 RepID=A0A4D7JSU4_9BACT|nr:hypothetical protein DCC35_13920 [Mangrovivirga cuniculi]
MISAFTKGVIKTINTMKKVLKPISKLWLLSLIAILFACDEEFVEPPAVDNSDLRVDLRPQQTSIKSQGSRNTCITFAAVAGLEAAYKRFGYGDIDMSEEFMNHFGKTFWIHPDWDDILAKGEDGSETQVGAFGGGGGAGYINDMMNTGLKIPLESLMPYRSVNITPAIDPTLASEDWQDDVYKKQRVKSDYNLDPNKLTRELLHSDKYYGVANGKFFGPSTGKARDTDFIEQILKREIELVWDFSGNAQYGEIWRPCTSGDAGCNTIAHSMLIVGFDKTSENPDDHYFLIKNSWGSSFTGTDDNFTKVSYDFIRQNGNAIAYIEIPILDPQQWQEFKFVGRWNLVFDGHDGILDIYHLPGYWNDKIDDKRIGSFYTPDGSAYKINGSIEGNKITFYLDGSNPNAHWGTIGDGRKFEYYLSDDDYMAGFHTDPDGKMYAGYAKKGSLFSEGATTPRPYLPESYENSTWIL